MSSNSLTPNMANEQQPVMGEIMAGKSAPGIKAVLPACTMDFDARLTECHAGSQGFIVDKITGARLLLGDGGAGTEPTKVYGDGATGRFEFDGGDVLLADSLPTPMRDFHKDGSNRSLMMRIKTPATFTQSAIVSSMGVDEGFRMQVLNTGVLRFTQFGGGATSANLSIGTLAAGETYDLYLNYNSDNDELQIYLYSLSDEEVDRTLVTLAYTHTATTADPVDFRVFEDTGTAKMASGSMFMALSFFDGALTQAQIDTVRGIYDKRGQGLVYQVKDFSPQGFPQKVLDNWGGRNGGTYFLDVEFATAGHPASGFGIYADDATNNNRTGWTGSNLGKIRFYSENGNDNRLDQVVSNSIFKNHTRFKICLTWDQERMEVWINGWLVFYQENPSFLEVTPVRTGICEYNGGSTLATDTNHEARYYNKRVSHETAARLTRCLDCNDYTGIADNKDMNAVWIWGQSNTNFGVNETRVLENAANLYKFDMQPVLAAYSEPYDADPAVNPYDNLLNDGTLYTAFPGKLLDLLAGGVGGDWCAVGAAKKDTSMKDDWGWVSFANDIYFGSFSTWVAMERLRLAAMKFTLKLAVTLQGESDALAAVATGQVLYGSLFNECILKSMRNMIGESPPMALNTIAGWYAGLAALTFDETEWLGVQEAQRAFDGVNATFVIDNSERQDGTLHFGFEVQDAIARDCYNEYIARYEPAAQAAA